MNRREFVGLLTALPVVARLLKGSAKATPIPEAVKKPDYLLALYGPDKEIDGCGYRRMGFSVSDFEIDPLKNGMVNKVDIGFPQALGDWGTVYNVGILSLDGDLLLKHRLTYPEHVLSFDTLRFTRGDFYIFPDLKACIESNGKKFFKA